MKLQKLQSFLTSEGWDAAFITTPDNVFYFSNFRSNPHERLLGVMVFQNADPLLICPQMEVHDAKASGWPFETVGHLDTDHPWELLTDAIKSRNVNLSTIAIEKSHLTVERLEALQQFYPLTNFVRLDEEINQLRVIKDESEIEKMRAAAKLADYAIEIGCKEIAEGKTEMDVLNKIEHAIKEKGYTMSFDTMVLSGPKTASPHGTPGNRQIQKGDMILFDLGVIYDGYCSDITRTVAFGQPTEEQLKIYHTVRLANEKAIAAVKPGVRAMDLDKIARDTITNAGYGDDFTHRLGHGLGISVHEYPSITGTNELTLQPGMIFTIEPGVYKENVTGVRIEDDVVVTKTGVEILTQFTKELVIL